MASARAEAAGGGKEAVPTHRTEAHRRHGDGSLLLSVVTELVRRGGCVGERSRRRRLEENSNVSIF